MPKPAVRWLRSHWADEDIEFWFEADEDGVVLRQIELSGPERVATTAASLVETPDAMTDGVDAVRDYESRWGAVAMSEIGSWDEGVPHDEMTEAEFDQTWESARATFGRS